MGRHSRGTGGRRRIVEQVCDRYANVGEGSTALLVFDAWEHACYLWCKDIGVGCVSEGNPTGGPGSRRALGPPARARLVPHANLDRHLEPIGALAKPVLCPSPDGRRLPCCFSLSSDTHPDRFHTRTDTPPVVTVLTNAADWTIP
ncbi:MAG: hypothetical protein JO362_19575 [Streptomycetaceae bacterium]|nr:hypothetical protein [Streptomycetaceae bacterium]